MKSILIPKHITDKKGRYKLLLPQINALVSGESDLIANLSNIMSALRYGMDFFWVGCYFVKNNELVLGPFQGPVACTRIAPGKGVCGVSWEKKQTIIVKNVDEFSGHIACNSRARSEIVVPVYKNKEVALVIDIDSDKLACFDETDAQYLEKIAVIIEKML